MKALEGEGMWYKCPKSYYVLKFQPNVIFGKFSALSGNYFKRLTVQVELFKSVTGFFFNSAAFLIFFFLSHVLNICLDNDSFVFVNALFSLS